MLTLRVWSGPITLIPGGSNNFKEKEMKLASLKHGRDGRLAVVSRDLKRMALASEIAPTLQAALDDLGSTAPPGAFVLPGPAVVADAIGETRVSGV